MPRKAKQFDQIRQIFSEHELADFENTDIVVLEELAEEVSEISDPRDESYIKHKLGDIIMIVFLSVLGGANEWEEIEIFAKEKERWFRKFLELPHGIPTDDTLRLVISKINVNFVYSIVLGLLIKKFDAILQTWIEPDAQDEADVVSLDGKESRGSKRKEAVREEIKPLNTLNAYSSNMGICLDQEFIDDKTNEIPAMPVLLKRLDIEGAVVTCDALNTQTATAEAVVKGHGNYVMALKGNHRNLLDDTADYFDEETRAEFIRKEKEAEKAGQAPTRYVRTTEKEHSSIVTREYFLETDISWLYGREAWAGLKSIGMVHKTIKPLNPNLPERYEDRYYINSVTNVRDFARAARCHWGVENSLHWQLDYTFRDDHNNTTRSSGAEGLQIFKKLALALLKFAQAVYPKRTSLKNIRFRLTLSFDREIERIFTAFDVRQIA